MPLTSVGKTAIRTPPRLFEIVPRALTVKEVDLAKQTCLSEPHRLFDKDRLGYSGNSKTHIRFVKRSAMPRELREKVWAVAKRANDKLWKVRVTSRLTDDGYSSLVYRRGMYITNHVDHDQLIGNRSTKLSCIVMLSDPDEYTGGELHMDTSPLPTRLRKGDAIVFPGYTVHGVSRVKSGTRHTMSAWFAGNPFK